jgi:hypothetical protein
MKNKNTKIILPLLHSSLLFPTSLISNTNQTHPLQPNNLTYLTLPKLYEAAPHAKS